MPVQSAAGGCCEQLGVECWNGAAKPCAVRLCVGRLAGVRTAQLQGPKANAQMREVGISNLGLVLVHSVLLAAQTGSTLDGALRTFKDPKKLAVQVVVDLSGISNEWLELVLRLGDGSAHGSHHDTSVARGELFRWRLVANSTMITILQSTHWQFTIPVLARFLSEPVCFRDPPQGPASHPKP
jgi:hypothetical protein